MKRSKLLLVSAIIGTLLMLYMMNYLGESMNGAGTSSEALGVSIAMAMVAPHLACAGLGLIFNWVGWLAKARWAALVAGILYAVAIALFFSWFFDSVVQMVLCFVAYATMGKREPK